MVSENGTRSVRFGTFELDLQAGELKRNGSKVRLQEQPLKVLAVLLERPGEVVTREQLQKALWPADTFVDFDHGLNAAIRRVRDALGDSAENPRFVETVARRGYRFLAPVNGAPAALDVAAPQLAIPAARSKHWPVMVPTAMLIVGVIVGLGIAYWPRASNRTNVSQFRQRRLTANPEDDPVRGAALSPNGKYLAFSDATGFYLREVDSGETHALPLPNGFSAVPVAWYPDGTHLIAAHEDGPYTQSGLWQLSIVGGTPRKLIDDGRDPAISPDGAQIAFVRGAYLQNQLWLMGADGENARSLIAGQTTQYGKPVWSPNGDKIALPVGLYHSELFKLRTNIEIYDLKSGQQKTLLSIHDARAALPANAFGVPPDETAQFGPAVVWTRDNHLVYSISEPVPNGADSNVWSAPLDDQGRIAGPSVRLSATPDEVTNLNVSAEGNRIAITKDSDNPDIYITELNAAGTGLDELRRITLDERRDLPFSWTPDSKSVIFASDRDGVFHIFKQRIDQTVPELLVGGNEPALGARLAPDNATVVYVTWPKVGELVTQGRIMRVPLSGGPPQTLVERNPGNLQCARAPSTLCLYDSHGTTDLAFYRFDPNTGESEQLLQPHIHDPAAYAYNWTLSPDGKFLAICPATAPGKNPSVTFISLQDGSSHTVEAPTFAGIAYIDFAMDANSVWAPAFTHDGHWALLKISMQGQIKTMLKEDKMELGWAIPAPDGKHLAIWKGRQMSNVWLMERL